MNKKFPMISCVALFAFSALHADPVTLQDLFDGQDIIVGDKLFSDWQFLNDDMSADLTQIEVIPLLDPLNQGLRYEANGQWSLANADLAFPSFEFTYDVTVLDPELAITDASLELTAFSFVGEGGAIEIQNAIFPPSLIVGVWARNGSNVFQLADTQQFAPDFAPQTFLDDVETIITFEGTAANSVRLDSFDVRYSQLTVSVPEPATLALLGIGLFGMGLARRRRKV